MASTTTNIPLACTLLKIDFGEELLLIVAVVLILALIIYFLLRRIVNEIKLREAQKTEIEKLKALGYQHQLEIEQVINYFVSNISEQKTIDGILWGVAKNCISKLGFEDCVIYMLDEQRRVLVQKAAWGPKTTEQNKIVNPIEIPAGKGIVGTVAVTGKPEIINDTSTDKRYIIDDKRRLSEITLPIVINGKILGVIDSEHPKKNFYTQRHQQILSTIASLCADKIDKLIAEEQTHQKEIELIKLSQDLATSRLTALRSQMNPHFIFNALNSVQQYILKGDVDEANRYLSKFSRLQREVLQHCDQNFISLEKEIEMLNLYLQLEQLRFNDNFVYNIRFSDDIDPSEIKIPPMMLQPFVENAIWHGLMPKKGDKEIAIDFMLQEDDLVVCTIKDNGIGREASAKLKQLIPGHNGSIHKSKGLALVLERLDVLQKHYRQTFEASISDMRDIGGNTLGTSVKLVMHTGN
ncbi:histidine kinase [Foetidibacter luteolus]|uniref:histidine kinase n=1 Tax=Foetidibacter luteolus TaxID=2608880 RepID=UPI00129B060E|nr:histidine kinase [Foetidibacter luteolus]